MREIELAMLVVAIIGIAYQIIKDLIKVTRKGDGKHRK